MAGVRRLAIVIHFFVAFFTFTFLFLLSLFGQYFFAFTFTFIFTFHLFADSGEEDSRSQTGGNRDSAGEF